MLIRVLAAATALLAALVVRQQGQIGGLRAQLADSQRRSAAEVSVLAADSMRGRGAEIERALVWLNDFYKSAEGLQREQGLWIAGHPDYAGIGVWIFEVYLQHRLQGESEEQARHAVEDAIKGSDEWRTRHRAPS